MVITASGPGAHPLTGHGFDGIAWDPKQRELWLIDNKGTGELGPLEGSKATALGPNLESSLAEAVDKVRKIQAFPDKAEIVAKLEKSLASVRAGKGIPSGIGVKLKLTNTGGYGGGTGVGARNLPPQTTAEDLVSPAVRKARGEDIAAAKVNEVKTSRPRSHADTEAARVKVRGAQSREPIGRSLSQLRDTAAPQGVKGGVVQTEGGILGTASGRAAPPKPVAPVAKPIAPIVEPTTPGGGVATEAAAGSFSTGEVLAGTVKTGAAVALPTVILMSAQHIAQENFDQAARLRDHYTGMPTQDQIERQRLAGWEFTGSLDKKGQPEWEYKPGLALRLRNALLWVTNPFFNPIRTSGRDESGGA